MQRRWKNVQGQADSIGTNIRWISPKIFHPYMFTLALSLEQAIQHLIGSNFNVTKDNQHNSLPTKSRTSLTGPVMFAIKNKGDNKRGNNYRVRMLQSREGVRHYQHIYIASLARSSGGSMKPRNGIVCDFPVSTCAKEKESERRGLKHNKKWERPQSQGLRSIA